jgi:hypothetical protein
VPGKSGSPMKSDFSGNSGKTIMTEGWQHGRRPGNFNFSQQVPKPKYKALCIKSKPNCSLIRLGPPQRRCVSDPSRASSLLTCTLCPPLVFGPASESPRGPVVRQCILCSLLRKHSKSGSRAHGFVCFTICLCFSSDLDGCRAPKMKHCPRSFVSLMASCVGGAP